MNDRFAAIMADPPWPYDSPRALVGNGGRGSEGAAQIVQADVSQHYNVMTLDAIKALPVALASQEHCLLFLWTTNPFLADGSAADVVRSWGFKPKSVLTWAKVQTDGETPSMKTGHWLRSASEHVILGVRGAPKRLSALGVPTWFPHRRLPHSVKPVCIYEIVEKMSEGPYLELFARRTAHSARWSVWGNEVESSFHLTTQAGP